jgi:exonuclease III
MPKAFSLLSWNVEHFKQDDARVGRVMAALQEQNPDVFALYEVEGKEVFGALTSAMPGYTFHITEGPQVQEILLGVRSSLSAFFTQKLEFRSGASLMRPGALLTLTIAGQHYTILFLHTASGNDPRGLGLRDDMLVRACEFRKTLDHASGASGSANYLFLGDLNTMGMRYRHVPTRTTNSPSSAWKPRGRTCTSSKRARRTPGGTGARPICPPATWTMSWPQTTSRFASLGATKSPCAAGRSSRHRRSGIGGFATTRIMPCCIWK